MTGQLVVRAATSAEIPAILARSGETALMQLSPREQAFAPPEAVTQSAAGMILNGLSRGAAVLVADDRAHLAGYVVVAAAPSALTGVPEAQVLDVYVSPAYRRRGLGRHLLDVACSWAWAQGIRQVALMVSLHNQPSLGNSTKAGFVPERVLFGRVLG